MTDPSGSGATSGCITAGSDVTDAMVDDALPKLTMTFGTGATAVTISADPLKSYLINAGHGLGRRPDRVLHADDARRRQRQHDHG